MPSLFACTDQLICDALRIENREHLKHKSTKLEPLSDDTPFRLVQRLYRRIVDNFPGRARSPSEKLWSCRHATRISDHNVSPEKTLEKAVAVLAAQGHMPDWFNQCPVATGIADPYADRNRSVDLVQLCGPTLRLVELKWMSDTLPFALFEVIEYGLAYLLARMHKRELRLEERPLMQDSVHHVRLEVVAPRAFSAGTSDHRDLDLFSRMHNALARFAEAQTNGEWSMSLHTLVFPHSFDTVPFASGKAVREMCARRTLSPEGRAVRDAFANLVPRTPDRFLPGVPGPDIERILDAAPGKELKTGNFDRPTSSAALTVNVFGFFLHRPADLPPLPGLERAGWPARSLALERTIRFPWTGGRHPVPDCLVATGSALVGIECKRFEPFRGGDYTGFTDTFWRPVWGDRMVGYQHVRDLLRGNKDLYAFLDAAQLVKHALALRAAVQSRKEYHGLAPILLYVYAEPDVWPGTGRQVPDNAKVRHREEIASFANHVGGDEVAFSACSYRQLLNAWRRGPDREIARHAAAVIDRFGGKRVPG